MKYPNSINEIKEFLDSVDINDLMKYIENFKYDDRKGVLALVSKYTKKYNSYMNEIERIKNMSFLENKYFNGGVEYIAGIDEVGRGPFAGPVATAAVILPKNCIIIGINDSKKLSPQKRKLLFDEIKQKAIAINISFVKNDIIDDINNITKATFLSMKKTIKGLSVKPQVIFVDALKIPNIDIPQVSIVKGDQKSISIAAASIVAKVLRDEVMIKFSKIYPQYSFEKNKGYGTLEHIEAIKKYGLCPIHRKTFTKKY